MKNLYLFITLILILILSSCSSNENDNVQTEKLIGTWIGVSRIYDGENMGNTKYSPIKFTADGKTEFNFINPQGNGDVVEKGTWKKVENDLQIIWDHNPNITTHILVSELTSNTLQFKSFIDGKIQYDNFKK
ncbi:MAG: lipocalin family protein [Chryseobacterium sp.]|nr:lipocalin family protein [Chryseobacterium sp.]MBP7498926.1 lipocalin family protein [Chryseobacterium sp.]